MATATRTVTAAGTTLATDAAVTEPRPSDVWRGRRNIYFIEEAKTVSRWAMFFGALVHAGSIAILANAHYPAWRIIALGGLYLVFAAIQRLFILRGQDEKCVEASFIGINLTAQIFVLVCATLTGGMHSPLLP